MPVINRITPITMTSVNANTLGLGAWTPLATPLEKPISILRITNVSDTSVFVSFNGIDTHDFLLPNNILELDFQANNMLPSKVANLSKTPGIYIKGVAGVGFIYCSGFTTFAS